MTARTVCRRRNSRALKPTLDYVQRIVPARAATFGNPHDPGSLEYRAWDDENFLRLVAEAEARDDAWRMAA